MRLSDVKGERTLDVIAEVIEPICNIAEDENAAELFRREKLPEGQTPREFAAARLKKGVPVLIKSHKSDIIAIMAAIEGVTPKQYAKKLNLAKLAADFMDLITDDEFMSLFTSAQDGGDSSGSARENTGGRSQ